jgi:hypothetical protein
MADRALLVARPLRGAQAHEEGRTPRDLIEES